MEKPLIEALETKIDPKNSEQWEIVGLLRVCDLAWKFKFEILRSEGLNGVRSDSEALKSLSQRTLKILKSFLKSNGHPNIIGLNPVRKWK